MAESKPRVLRAKANPKEPTIEIVITGGTDVLTTDFYNLEVEIPFVVEVPASHFASLPDPIE